MNKVSNNILSWFQTSVIPIRRMRNLAIKDAGIKRRAQVLQGLPELEEIDIEDMEADFHSIGKTHKQHQREVEKYKQQEKIHIVKQKYFKQKWPNYLTWADKQQIKHLHRSNPEEWDIDKLSEGFPALPETIQKIIKNNWTPKNAERIKHHDQTVQQNWKEYQHGNADHLPIELKTHLSKFTSRELNLNPTDLAVDDVTQRQLVKKGGEFSQIIQSYENLKQKNSAVEVVETPQKTLTNRERYERNVTMNEKFSQIAGYCVDANETKTNIKEIIKQKKAAKLLTYEELQRELVAEDHIEDSTATDEFISKEIVLKTEEIDFNIDKFKMAAEQSQVNLYKPQRNYVNLTYPEHINIPKGKLQNGCTYKLNDCYYDSDGEFLYRVPGMQ